MAYTARKTARQQSSTAAGQKQAGPAAEQGHRVLRSLGGSKSDALNNVLAQQALNCLWFPRGQPEAERQKLVQAGMAALVEFKPADGIEYMMAAQALALHSASIECLRRAMPHERSFEVSTSLRRQGANLSRSFLDGVAVLDRKRGKTSRQVVRIERVMVAPGGQAIVGNAQSGGPGPQQREGGRYEKEIGEEPRATPARLANDASLGAALSSVRSPASGRGCPADRRPCRTAGAGCTAAAARGLEPRRAWRAFARPERCMAFTQPPWRRCAGCLRSCRQMRGEWSRRRDPVRAEGSEHRLQRGGFALLFARRFCTSEPVGERKRADAICIVLGNAAARGEQHPSVSTRQRDAVHDHRALSRLPRRADLQRLRDGGHRLNSEAGHGLDSGEVAAHTEPTSG